MTHLNVSTSVMQAACQTGALLSLKQPPVAQPDGRGDEPVNADDPQALLPSLVDQPGRDRVAPAPATTPTECVHRGRVRTATATVVRFEPKPTDELGEQRTRLRELPLSARRWCPMNRLRGRRWRLAYWRRAVPANECRMISVKVDVRVGPLRDRGLDRRGVVVAKSRDELQVLFDCVQRYHRSVKLMVDLIVIPAGGDPSVAKWVKLPTSPGVLGSSGSNAARYFARQIPPPAQPTNIVIS